MKGERSEGGQQPASTTAPNYLVFCRTEKRTDFRREAVFKDTLSSKNKTVILQDMDTSVQVTFQCGDDEIVIIHFGCLTSSSDNKQ